MIIEFFRRKGTVELKKQEYFYYALNLSGGFSSDMTEKGRHQVDLLLGALSHHRRREIIAYLDRSDTELFHLDDLAKFIATQENVSPEDAALSQEQVKIDLHHRHIPVLVEARIIEYDSRSGDIRYHGITENDMIDVSQLLNIHEETMHNIDV